MVKMVSKGRAALNSAALTLPLVSTLAFCALTGQPLPESIIIPIAGGGIMNIGFWHFYHHSIGKIPEIGGSAFCKRDNFLIIGLLHFLAMPLAILIDLSWLSGFIRL